jgi:hypothetical protein
MSPRAMAVSFTVTSLENESEISWAAHANEMPEKTDSRIRLRKSVPA